MSDHVDAGLLERLLQRPSRALVLAGKQLVEHLDDRDLAAEPGEDGGELAADHAAADDRQPRGHVVDRQQLVARHHARVVPVEDGEADRLGARRQDDGVALERAAVVEDEAAGAGERSPPGHDLDLAPLEQLRDAVAQLRRRALLARHEGGEVEARPRRTRTPNSAAPRA